MEPLKIKPSRCVFNAYDSDALWKFCLHSKLALTCSYFRGLDYVLWHRGVMQHKLL